MKVSIYIEEGLKQINLIPENTYELDVLKSIKDKENEIEFNIGSFSTCSGGWIRRYNRDETNDDYLFLTLKGKK